MGTDLTLYRAVGNLNRVALGDLADSEFYAASKDPRTGIISLAPVNIIDGATKRTSGETVDLSADLRPAADGAVPDDVPFGADNVA